MKHDETTNEELAIMINNGFQSLTDTVNGMRTDMGVMKERLDGIDGRLDGIDGRLDGIDGRLDSLEEKTEYIDQKLSRIDRRQEQQMDEQYSRMSAAENDIKEIRKHVGLKPAKASA